MSRDKDDGARSEGGHGRTSCKWVSGGRTRRGDEDLFGRPRLVHPTRPPSPGSNFRIFALFCLRDPAFGVGQRSRHLPRDPRVAHLIISHLGSAHHYTGSAALLEIFSSSLAFSQGKKEGSDVVVRFVLALTAFPPPPPPGTRACVRAPSAHIKRLRDCNRRRRRPRPPAPPPSAIIRVWSAARRHSLAQRWIDCPAIPSR